MSDIYHSFVVKAPAAKIFEAISLPKGLDSWWTKRCTGQPASDSTYEFYFSPDYIWNARVTSVRQDEAFEWQMTSADKDWLATKLGFTLHPKGNLTEVSFYHTGWPQSNEHFRISSFCWAMYLRLLKRYVEFGEIVPYERRMDV